METSGTDLNWEVSSLKAMVDAITDCAVVKLDSGGRIDHWSAGARTLFGYSHAEVTGVAVSILHSGDDRDSGLADSELVRARESGFVEFSGWRVRKGGRRFWASSVIKAIHDEAGSVTGFIEVIRDEVADQQRAHPLFAYFLEAAPDAMVVIGPDGRITMANAQAGNMFGYWRDGLIGVDLEILLPERFRDVHVRHRADFFAHPMLRPMGRGIDLFGRRQDGSEFYVDISLSPIHIGQTTYVLASIRDITKRREQEVQLRRATVLQSALVPDNPGDTGGLDVYVAYKPADVAEGLGGDWHDVMSLPGGRIYFSVGDVSGHGLPAVQDMAQLRTAGRTLAYLGLSPARLLAELNAFTGHASQRKFATMAVAVFDPTAIELTYCSAGHPPPLLRRAATGEVLRLSDTSGAVLGPMAGTSYAEGSLRVFPNDVLVMYTDGLVERPGVDIESGISQAEKLIADWRVGFELASNCAALHETLSPPPRADDVCVLAIRFP